LADRLFKPLDDASREALHVQRSVAQGFPVEAFDEPALFLAYVEAKRGEYQSRLAKGWESLGQISEPFRHMLFVDEHFIIGHIPEATITTGRAWRLQYLRRLKHEGGDPAYVAACAATWEVNADEIAVAPWSPDYADRVRKRWGIAVGPSKQEQVVKRLLEARREDPQTDAEKQELIIQQIKTYSGNEAALRAVRERAEDWVLDFDELMEQSQQQGGGYSPPAARSSQPTP
jgi:hypothetical protein